MERNSQTFACSIGSRQLVSETTSGSYELPPHELIPDGDQNSNRSGDGEPTPKILLVQIFEVRL